MYEVYSDYLLFNSNNEICTPWDLLDEEQQDAWDTVAERSREGGADLGLA